MNSLKIRKINEESKSQLKTLEAKKSRILAWHEAKWGIKSRGIWILKINQNITFFHVQTKGNKAIKLIWNIIDQLRKECSNFKSISKASINHYKTFFMELMRDNIGDNFATSIFFK